MFRIYASKQKEMIYVDNKLMNPSYSMPKTQKKTTEIVLNECKSNHEEL